MYRTDNGRAPGSPRAAHAVQRSVHDGHARTQINTTITYSYYLLHSLDSTRVLATAHNGRSLGNTVNFVT